MKKIFDDSLEDLISVVTEEVFLNMENEREVRQVVAGTLGELLSNLVPVSNSWH
ncbi:MAG: hypothetical protein ACREP8_05835 [Candidatus Binatia bacterium]